MRKLRKLGFYAVLGFIAAMFGIGVTLPAQAAPAVIYTDAGVNATAGWEAYSPDLVNFTHIESYIGSSGDSSWESLPVAAITTSPLNTIASSTMPGNGKIAGTNPITGGVGIQLCDRSSGAAAQIGVVNVGGGLFDVVEALGTFGSHANNSSGDVCDNGLLGDAHNGSTAVLLKVLLTGVKANDTVQAGILYDLHDAYHFGPHHAGAGDVTFYATDLSNSTDSNYDILPVHTYLAGLIVTNEADAGVVADTATSVALGPPVPAPNGGPLESSAPNELVRFAHVKVNGNSTVTGGHEVEGAFQSSAAWSVTPVAATTDGLPTGQIYLKPTAFAADNFAVEGGTGIVS
jgi:hypothetical protein